MALMGTDLEELAQASQVLLSLGANVWSMPPDASPRDIVRFVTASVGCPPTSLVTIVNLQKLRAAPRAWFEQVECSDVILILGAPMGEDLAVLRRLQPRATLLRLDDLRSVDQFRRFDAEKTAKSSGVYSALELGLGREQTVGRSEVLACDSHLFVYRAQAAFDAAKWERVMREWPAAVLRAFGCVTIGERAFVLDQAGAEAPQLIDEGDGAAGSQLVLIGSRLNGVFLEGLLDSALVARPSSLRLLATRRRQRYGAP